MIKKPITLKLRDGLEARPIALLVQEANQYSSTLKLRIKRLMRRALWA